MTIALQAVIDRPGAPPGLSADAADEGEPDQYRLLRYEVDGRLDVEASHEVRDVERPAGPDTVVEIDLHKCEGMDEFGFGSLVGLIRRAREHQAQVRVRGADDDVQDGLRRSGVARLVEVVPTGDGR